MIFFDFENDLVGVSAFWYCQNHPNRSNLAQVLNTLPITHPIKQANDLYFCFRRSRFTQQRECSRTNFGWRCSSNPRFLWWKPCLVASFIALLGPIWLYHCVLTCSPTLQINLHSFNNDWIIWAWENDRHERMGRIELWSDLVFPRFKHSIYCIFWRK